MSASSATAAVRARRSRRPGHPLRWRVEALLASTGGGALSALSDDAARGAGRAAGHSLCWRYPRYRNTALANARVAFPDWSEGQRRDLVRESFGTLGSTIAAWVRLPASRPEEVLERVEWEGVEHLERAFARGRGVVGVTAHFGFWELVLPAIRLRFAGRAITAVEREVRNPHLRRFVARRRQIGGGDPLPQHAKSILRALRSGAGIGVLADHYLAPRDGGVLAPFFGRDAWTNPGPATLARRTGSPLLPVHAEPISGDRQRIVFGDEIEVPRTGNVQEDVALATRRINAAIETWVQRRPEHWVWVNKRWKRSPDVTSDLYRRHGSPRRAGPSAAA